MVVENILYKKQLEDLKPTERPIHCSDKKEITILCKRQR